MRAGVNALCIEGLAHLGCEIMFLQLEPAIRFGVILAWPQAAPKRALCEALLEKIKTLTETS